ncbi:MAG: translation initiation factor IF-2 N-terminal domain-containing protein, partial [Lachnospiraceae bacterium]|nr:translation initiation factor IF-2 N-terminal domain-containing protein [Lachnospiraceae bacterium]
MKVHELAKELDVQSKDIIAFLHEKGIEVKAAQSSIDDDAVASVRKQFSKKAAPKAPAPKAEAPKAEPAKEAPVKAEAKAAPAEAKPAAAGDAPAPVKKKKIIFVNNPHNSKMPGQSQGGQRPQGGNGQRPQSQGGQRPQGQANGQRPTGERRNVISGNAYSNHLIKPRPEAINRKIPDKVEEVEEVVKETAPVVKPEPQPQKNVSIIVEEAPKKEYLRRDNNASRPQGDRPQRDGNRPAFNRDGNRPQGDRPQRGDRPAPQGRDCQRPARQGDRPGFNRDGQRPAFNRDGQRPQGDRPARPGNAGAGSFAAAPAMPGKPSGDRRDNKSKSNKNFDPTRDGGKQQNRRNQKDDTRGKQKYITVEDEESLEVKRKKGKFIKPEAKPVVEEEVIKVITLPDTITIKDLADKMKIQPAAIVKKLFLEGKIVTVNQEISFEEAENIAIDYEIICEKEVKVDVIEELLKEDAEDEKDLVERPPVVCVMGHVDH